MKNINLLEETHPLTWRFRKDKKTVWIKEYIKKNGYFSLNKAIKEINPKDIIKKILKSGLKGRGGAGFLTGLKWSLMPKDENCNKKYLICNADEMEPGTYKDRWIIENCPHQVIEGMIIGAYALNVSLGYIFLRGEYINPEKILKRAIKEAYKKKFLGKNILNSNFSFDLVLHTGAGRYICGEETALINSLEGKRANPRIKPPFPANIGLWGYPTCVNNVETLSNIPAIISNSIDWYKNLSKNEDSGTKLMGFSGLVNKPGIWELPFGITAREILEDYALGMKNNLKLKAWLPGGAGTDFLIKKHLDVPMGFSSIQKVGSRLGTGLALAIDENVNMIDLVLNLEIFFSRESCGLCTPCRDGLPWVVNILKSLKSNKGKEGDIEILENLCIQMGPGKTLCAHAPGAVSPLKSAIKYFRNDFEFGINKKNKNFLTKINGIQSNLI
ncbi:MAG: NADH-quinone oxidoreductase subunit NuoF [Buchnera aphidicola (Periphyllus lyropictus)]|uniref:NADH-quinone oxidoreductase subunit NuoF n=1 Tax=Buchnera aphidicola TaxID=9 RepID=UPI001EC9FF49|nr:NADH-quinone oxidoreductase subunit NuoF [Buchnera aphidicola]NIH16687.1 NADH-quinone oxidoreductase subunit NuoF [Buchnera aphidicola (Periphyllus lyropictus)]USS94594.1 NADH-quinone oxidoreductase subunit NuoF [Buchnera aphidicola (Periphyllus lyropictus)]